MYSNILPRCLESLCQLGVRPPVSVFLTLVGVRGLRMAMGAFSFDQGNEIREKTLILPGAAAESFSASAGTILRPMFDRVWNACGLLRPPNFDEPGNWVPRSGIDKLTGRNGRRRKAGLRIAFLLGGNSERC